MDKAYKMLIDRQRKELKHLPPDQRAYRLLCTLYFTADHIAATATVLAEEIDRLQGRTRGKRPKLKVVDLAKVRRAKAKAAK